MRIAFLSRYQNKVNRGVETYVAELSARLNQNHEVEVLSGQDADSFSRIIKGKYDLVIPTNGRLQALKASIGRISGGYKIIISGQAGVGKDDIWNIFLTAPDVYVALTDFEKHWAQKWAWKTRIVKINNGVDLEKFSTTSQKVKINLPKPIILSVGALEWYKHHERTIRAMAEFNKGSLLIIGAGSEEDKLQKMGMQLLGEDRFQIIQAGYKDLPKYYRSCDLFVLPSWDRESFGIVYVEAMACGLVVVAPDDQSRREIIGQAGILTDVSDLEKYATAIDEALKIDWKNKPRKQAEKFSWDKIAEQYENLFKEL
ncbi:glycosyltransferase family 4 protein [Candidatus Microgenomates bacterium]|nr:glycosyltransferase family 4 protein [Candidatus Microgenomates bacterium]